MTEFTDIDDTSLTFDDVVMAMLDERHGLRKRLVDPASDKETLVWRMDTAVMECDPATVLALLIDVYKVLVRKVFPDAYCQFLGKRYMILREPVSGGIAFAKCLHGPTELQAWYAAHNAIKEEEND